MVIFDILYAIFKTILAPTAAGIGGVLADTLHIAAR
jgi:hypothetical protein